MLQEVINNEFTKDDNYMTRKESKYKSKCKSSIVENSIVLEIPIYGEEQNESKLKESALLNWKGSKEMNIGEVIRLLFLDR